jgi:hypothetical protein
VFRSNRGSIHHADKQVRGNTPVDP